MSAEKNLYDVTILREKGKTKGLLGVSLDGITVMGQEIRLDWRQVAIETGNVGILALLIFSKKEKYIIFKTETYQSEKIAIAERSLKDIEKLIKSYREELKAREEVEHKARETELKAREEIERRAREEMERKVREEMECKAREEAERKAREEVERKAREEMGRKAREEVNRKKQEEAERIHQEKTAKLEAERSKKSRQIWLEVERKKQEETECIHQEKIAKLEAERSKKSRQIWLEVECKAKEAKRKEREEAECKGREKVERKAREEAEHKTREPLARKAIVESIRKEENELERIQNHILYEDVFKYVNRLSKCKEDGSSYFLGQKVSEFFDELILNETAYEISFELLDAYNGLYMEMEKYGVDFRSLQKFHYLFEETRDVNYMFYFFQDLLKERYFVRVEERTDGYDPFDLEALNFKNRVLSHSIETLDLNTFEELAIYDDLNDLYELETLDNELEGYESSYQEMISSVTSQMYDYVKAQSKPVKKEFLMNYFGYWQAALNELLEKRDILDYGDQCFCADNIIIQAPQQMFLLNSIKSVVKNNVWGIHVEAVYDTVKYEYRTFLTQAYISDFKRFYSVIEYLYNDKMYFENHFVSLYRMDGIDSEDRMNKFIFSKAEMLIDEINSYAKSIHFSINSILSYIMSVEGIFIKDREYVISEELVNLSQRDIDKIESLIYEELKWNDDCVAIRDLKCIGQFPKVDVLWDEWLIYSLLYKYGHRLSLSTTTKKFKYAIPVVALSSEISLDVLNRIKLKHTANLNRKIKYQADDLDNLDILLEDVIDLDDLDLFDESILGNIDDDLFLEDL